MVRDTRVSCLTSVAVLMFLAGGARGQCTGLAPSQSFASTLPDNIRQLEAADINGDGFVDLVLVSRLSRVQAYLNSGTGVLTAQPVGDSPAFGTICTAAAVADFSGDGLKDLAVMAGGRVSVSGGDGNGGFASQGQMLEGAVTGFVLLTADVDGDGWVDLVTVDEGGNACVAFNNHGTFAGFVSVGTGGWASGGVAVADSDGDGKLDLIGLTSSAISVQTNAGNRSFGAGPSWPVSVVNPRMLRAGDLSGDGRADFVVLSDLGDLATVSVFVRGASESLVSRGSFVEPWTGKIFLVDFDLDGDVDIVGTQYLSGPAHLLTNFGNASFAQADAGMPSEIGGSLIFTATVGDFSGDGAPDVATDVSNGPRGVKVFRNTTSLHLTEQPRDLTLTGGASYAIFRVGAPEGAATYRWQWQRGPGAAWEDLEDGAVDGLGTVSGAHEAAVGIDGVGPGASGAMFRARVLTDCRPFVSMPARLTIEAASCPADFNGDGFIDFFDYDDFIAAFETGC